MQLKSPADAIAHGIGFVSQHFALVPTFTVAENILLGHERRALLSRDDMRRVVAETAATLPLQRSIPMRVVGDLAVGQQQRVEILKALYRGCRILILDEPTAVLTPRDTASLFDTLRELQQDGLVGDHHHAQAGRGAGDQPAGDRAAARQGRRAGATPKRRPPPPWRR